MASGKASIQPETIRSLGRRVADAVQALWSIALGRPPSVETVASASPVFPGSVEKSMPITVVSTESSVLPPANGGENPTPYSVPCQSLPVPLFVTDLELLLQRNHKASIRPAAVAADIK